MTMIGRDEIDRRLGFHPATADTIPLFEDNRARVIELACHWDETIPDGREKALAFTALQEAAMWANAAVACDLAPLEDPAGRQPNPLTEASADRDRVGRPLPPIRPPRAPHNPPKPAHHHPRA